MKPFCLLVSLFVCITAPINAVSQSLAGDQIAQLTRGAEAGNPKAEYELGRRYESGDRVPKDKTKAVELYKKAAEQGYTPAQARYASFVSSPEERLLWLRKAATGGDYAAARTLANTLVANGDTIDNYIEAAKWWEIVEGPKGDEIRKVLKQIEDAGLMPGLRAGEASSQCRAALILLSDSYLPGSTESGTKLMAKAANQGNADAQYLVGELITKQPRGSQQEMIRNYSEAASHGNIEAEVRLGDAAVHRGNFNLGCYCFDKADYTEALQHFQRAAAANSAAAYYKIGELYESGFPTPPSIGKAKSKPIREPKLHDAFENYSKAAELGSPAAQLLLVRWYSGQKPEAQAASVPLDIVKAAMWASVLKSSGDKESHFQGNGALNFLIEPSNRQQAGITTAQLQEAQHLADAWLTKFKANQQGQKGYCR